MRIKYTRHAKNRMRLYEIPENDVEKTLEDPEFIEQTIENRNNAWKKIGDKYLRVTFKQEDKMIIISVTPKKRLLMDYNFLKEKK